MKFHPQLFTVLLLSVSPIAFGQDARSTARISVDERKHNVPPDGFVALFNGKDLSGWRGMEHFDPRQYWALSADERDAFDSSRWTQVREHWSVEDGELVNDGQGPYLTTVDDFRNFELWVEYKTVPLADSGIYLRGTPQVQIWDYSEAGGKWELGADRGSGGLWNNHHEGKTPLVLADKPFGEWNQLRIRLQGERVSVWLNDRLVVDEARLENFWDPEQPVFEKGPIQLQTHGGEIRWRNIFLRALP